MQTIVVLDFGGQYKELIARRIRECGVFSVILSGQTAVEEIRKIAPIGIVLTGGPDSVYQPNAPKRSSDIFELGVPVLGICYGMQLMAYALGGEVKSCSVSEYGKTLVKLNDASPLFDGIDGVKSALMSHTDFVSRLPSGFDCIASTANCDNAAMQNKEKKLFAVQFHPETELTQNGTKIFENFLYNICQAKGEYIMQDFIQKEIENIRKQVGSEKVLLGLSGGVDSSVCAALLSRAIGKQLVCIFVDHGFMRKNEPDEIEAAFANRELQFVRVDAEQRFLTKVKGVTDPEQKRKIIGEEFIRVFEEEAKKFGDIKFLAQGTIYPDIVESGANNTANIKSHHNVGGLPKHMSFKELVEPLRSLFKNEVRQLGRELQLPSALTERQPFPGPGLAVRVIGELTKEKLDILRDADLIFRQELENSGEKASQYFAVLTGLRSVGVMGDTRTYGYTIALRAVITTDFMTAEYAPLSHELLSKAASRITNEVNGVNRIVYDITSKPPSTIEWE